jgi:cytochrome b5
MLDVAGQDADEFFEDIGHSNEARKELKKLCIGNFKLDAKALEAMKIAAEKKKAAKSAGAGTGIFLIMLGVIAAVVYRLYIQNQ